MQVRVRLEQVLGVAAGIEPLRGAGQELRVADGALRTHHRALESALYPHQAEGEFGAYLLRHGDVVDQRGQIRRDLILVGESVNLLEPIDRQAFQLDFASKTRRLSSHAGELRAKLFGPRLSGLRQIPSG